MKILKKLLWWRFKYLYAWVVEVRHKSGLKVIGSVQMTRQDAEECKEYYQRLYSWEGKYNIVVFRRFRW